ncbi:FIG005080: Possible exported protein [hydrothermal vent metagenome]|uniref:FIG005080: Possible exported protein n=1 Tax=hydrothermal vent metagenome TaxID=652676 RepID=A0A3B1B0L7_9ZZZZ
MQKKPHYLRRFRRFIFYSLAATVVFLAVLMSVLRMVVSEADSWRMDLQKLASRYLERQVYIEALDARLDGIIPVLVLKNVHLMSANGKTELFSFRQAQLHLDIINSIKTRTFVPGEFTIQGAEITVVRHKDRSFSFKGMKLKKPDQASHDMAGSDEFVNWLLQRKDLKVQNSTVIWIDQRRGQAGRQLKNVNIHLHNNAQHHQLKVSLKLPETLGRSFELALDAWGRVDLKPSAWRGKLYLHGNGVHLARLGMIPLIHDYQLLGGMTDFELWGEWDKGRVKALSGDLTAYNLSLQHPDMPQPLQIKLLGGLFDYHRTDGGWALDIKRFHFLDGQGSWPETNISIQQQNQKSSNYRLTQIQAGKFRLENVSSLLLHSGLLSKPQTQILTNMAPSADVENFQLRFSDNPDRSDIALQASVSQLGFHSWKDIPGVRGLNGDIRTEHKQIRLTVNSDYAVVDSPRLFRAPLKISTLSGMFKLQRYQQGWQLLTDSLIVQNEDLETQSSVLLDIPDNSDSPFMDLQVQIKNANVAHAYRYYPVGIMSSDLVKWLDRGLVAGRITHGGIVFQGRLDDFPFRHNEGQFQVKFEAQNARIDYLDGWPPVHDAHLYATFTGQGMDIEADAGRILDSRLSATKIQIKDFNHSNLSVTGEVKGTLKDALRFLVESPIQPQAKSLVDSFHYHGKSRIDLDLSIPLSEKVRKMWPLAVSGKMHLTDAELLMLDDLVDIKAINGSLYFTDENLSARGIQARIMGGKARLDIHTADKGWAAVIDAQGKVDSHHLAQKFGLPDSLAINGIADWRASLSIPGKAQVKTAVPVLKIRSQMKGVEIKLPLPLGKSKSESRDTLLEVHFEHAGKTLLYARSKGYVSGAVLLDTESKLIRPQKAYVHFGAGEGHLPDTPSLLVSGSLSMFSLTPWLDALAANAHQDTSSLVSLPLVFAMDSLQFAPASGESNPAVAKKPTLKLDADRFPLIQGSINKLSYDDVSIGRVKIRTSRLKFRKGVHLDSLSLQGKQLKLQASGEWVQWPNRDLSSLQVKLESPDIGKMLSSLGFSAIIQGGKTTLAGSLHWPDSPMGISLSKIESKLKYTIEDGSIISIEPGTGGRLLGLFSLAALPRRLMLDFSDAFGKGLHFDSINGVLNIHDGSVFMDKNLMKSPLADISVSGRMGLVGRDFDQLVTVRPRGGDALTAVAGGMLFGPQIGAAILLVQKILGNELKDVTAIRYKVSGTWEKPVITRLDKLKTSDEPSLDEDEF